MTMMVI